MGERLNRSIEHFMRILTVKELWKSVFICRSCDQKTKWLFFWITVYKLNKALLAFDQNIGCLSYMFSGGYDPYKATTPWYTPLLLSVNCSIPQDITVPSYHVGLLWHRNKYYASSLSITVVKWTDYLPVQRAQLVNNVLPECNNISF